MGNIRPKYIKGAARLLLHWYPDEFTTDFETNKRLVQQYTDAKTKKVRNGIAGYCVTLVKIQHARDRAEIEEEGEVVFDGDTEM